MREYRTDPQALAKKETLEFQIPKIHETEGLTIPLTSSELVGSTEHVDVCSLDAAQCSISDSN